MRWNPLHKALLACVLVCGPLCAGCATKFEGGPRTRVGSLPFPGLFSLYEAADPDDLGIHCSGSPLARLGHRGEQERGTLYTRRAGFIDLSHVREAVDWVHYFHTQHLEALRRCEADDEPHSYTFSYCQARFDIEVRMPSEWRSFPDAVRTELIEETAIRAAQRLAIITTTWHEVATWLGYQTVPGISEAGSSFTWDDSTAHIIAATVGGRALRDPGDWDRAVTRELNDELRELRVVSREELREAALLVRERWWKYGVAVRRDLDVGLEDNHKVPWLVPEFGADPVTLMLPSLHDIHGHDAGAALSFRITPARWLMRRLSGESDPPNSLEGEAGLLKAVELVREHMREQWGDGFDQP